MSANRHVRWGIDDRLIQNTPSPSWSDASLPSTTGPITPPHRDFELPMQGTYRAQPALSVSSEEQLLVYDLSLPAHTVSLPMTKVKSNMSDVLTQTASIPNLHLLEISHPKLAGWRMYIHARGAADPSVGAKNFLTVGEVIWGLYANLREPVSEDAFRREPKDRQARIAQAFQQRVNRAGKKQDREQELRKGLKRIDWLEGEDMFKGFEPAPDGVGHHWRLVTGTPERH